MNGLLTIANSRVSKRINIRVGKRIDVSNLF